jgi:inward rectifier potassium channel
MAWVRRMERVRRQIIDLGGFRAVKLGAPSVWEDLYYSTMEMSWPVFVLSVSAAFALINLAFGAAYALLPGAIGNMTPGSLADGFFFSAETLGTVGYGNMAPATSLGHSIAVVEILLGLFYSATITGLIFARFARPRNAFVISRNAIIGDFDGRRALMVRLASTRARPLADVNAQLAWLERLDLPDGRVFRRLVELPLVRANNPMMGLLAAWRDAPEFRLTLTVTGLDTLLATQSIGGRSYGREDVLLDHEFIDAVDEEGGQFRLDLRKLHLVRPAGAVPQP